MKNRINFFLIPAIILLLATPLVSWAQCTASGNTIEFCNPLNFNSVQGVLGSLLNALQGIIVAISIVFIVIGAVLYITSAGDEERIKTAKKAITASLIGLAIGIAAPSFLKEIYTILGGTPTVDCTGLTGADLTACNQANATLTAGLPLATIILNVLNFLLSVVGALSMIMMVVGGVMYLTSGGDEEKIKSAKKITLYSIIGIAVALAALVLVKQIAKFFVA
jgi:hypothetical protein